MKSQQFFVKEWEEKRLAILSRDNFTCQNCNTFNPSLGIVQIFNEEDKEIEFHKYESAPGFSIYRLSYQTTGFSIEIDFGTNWLVLPVMQIHHKRYVENRDIWEYEDSDLITLCKNCHELIHKKIEIPLFDSNLNLIGNKIYQPEDNSCGNTHNYEPWVFIKFNSQKEYIPTDVSPKIRYILSAKDLDNINKIEKKAQNMVHSFFKRYLTNYSQNNPIEN